jgi:hypothetical protein
MRLTASYCDFFHFVGATLFAGARILGAGRRGAFAPNQAPCGRRAGSRKGHAFLVGPKRGV